MNRIKFLMALAAVFILIVPAFSMPYNGMGQDDKQKLCDCQKPMMGQDDKQKQKHTCFGQDGKEKSCDCEKFMMGQDEKEKSCHEGKHVKSMMEPCCKSMPHKHIKSMMGGRDGEGNGGVKIVVINLRV